MHFIQILVYISDSLTGETSIIKRKKLNPTDDTVENKSCMAEGT